MTMKKLLVAFNTDREVEAEGKTEMRRVRFAAGSVVDLTADELELLTRLQNKSGKLHFRTPVNEGGSAATESQPTIVEVPDYAGQDTPIAEKGVDLLKAYLDFHGVAYEKNATKPTLLDLAKKHEAGELDPSDKDSGL